MNLSVAVNRASKARKMLAFFDEQEAAGFPAWTAEEVASGRRRFRASLAEATWVLLTHGWNAETIERTLAA